MNRLPITDSLDRKIIPFKPHRRPAAKAARRAPLSFVAPEDQIFRQALAAPVVPFGFFSSLMTAKHLRPL